MIAGAKVKVSRSNTKLYRETAQKSPTLMRNGLQIIVRRERAAINEDIPDDVPLPDHPFLWSLEPEKQKKARRWYFQQIRLGKIETDGKRYIRKGSILKAFKLVTNFNDFDGVITLKNTAPGAEWVVGPKQVPSHARSGWPNIDKLAAKSYQRMNANARVLWRTISRPQIAGG